MSVLIILDKTAYPTEVDSYEDTEEFNYAFSARNGQVFVYENPVSSNKKSKTAAIYNFKHVVLIQGTTFPSLRDREEAMM